MKIRDRIREFRRVRASQLRPHPRNWRTHPPRQQDALRGVLAEIGYAGALVARELDDGTLELIDGHLRAETTPDMEVPVLVVDLNEEEAARLLVVHDPLTNLGEINEPVFAELLAEFETQSAAVRAMVDDVVKRPRAPVLSTLAEPPPLELRSLYQVVVECADEAEQRAVFEKLTAENHKCRVLTI